MKIFTPSEKRILWSLAVVLCLGLLIREGRHFLNRLSEDEKAAREAERSRFREGTEKYIALSDSESVALWKLGLQSPVDVNRASVEELQVIPGIGPVLAKKIVVYREKNGYFQSIDDLTKVRGIGPRLIQRWEGLIVVQPDRVKEGVLVE